MKAYRYTVDGQGFLTDYFKPSEFFPICWVFEAKLPLPNINMEDTTSYFTEVGNKTFRKAIKKARLAYESRGVSWTQTITEIKDEDILYKDRYQIITLREN